MGQKVHPHGLRVGVIKDWDSKWYADKKNFGDNLVEDYEIRKYLKKSLFSAGIAKIEIERNDNKVRVHIHTAKPGVVIGKGGAEKDKIKAQVEKLYVAEIFATQGPTLKRVRPRAQGRAFRIRKRTSHITIALKEKE